MGKVEGSLLLGALLPGAGASLHASGRGPPGPSVVVGGGRLALSVEGVTPGLGVVSSSPSLGVIS